MTIGLSLPGGRSWATRVAALGVCILLVGCGSPLPVDYPVRTDRLVVALPEIEPTALPALGRQDEAIQALDSLQGGKTLDPLALPADVQLALQASLRELFGTPSGPSLPTDVGTVAGLNVSKESLAQGAALYSQACINCHGSTGNGRGYGVGYVYPLPRDYRAGQFKCADGAAKPTIARLRRVLREGVPGTQMPMIDLFNDEELDAVIAYVMHLSVRGECEARVIRDCLDSEFGLEAAEVAQTVRDQCAKALGQWAASGESVANAPFAAARPKAAAMTRGAALYFGKGGCVACHGEDGAGGKFRYDVWGQVGRTGNLTLKSSEYKWGGRAEDIAGHLRGGIRASGMPAAGLTEAEISDVVAYVQGLSLGKLPPGLPGRLTQ